MGQIDTRAWGTWLLPYVEQTALQKGFRLDLPCWAPENATLVKTKLAVFLCPSASGGNDGFALEYAASLADATTMPLRRTGS